MVISFGPHSLYNLWLLVNCACICMSTISISKFQTFFEHSFYHNPNSSFLTSLPTYREKRRYVLIILSFSWYQTKKTRYVFIHPILLPIKKSLLFLSSRIDNFIISHLLKVLIPSILDFLNAKFSHYFKIHSRLSQ